MAAHLGGFFDGRNPQAEHVTKTQGPVGNVRAFLMGNRIISPVQIAVLGRCRARKGIGKGSLGEGHHGAPMGLAGGQPVTGRRLQSRRQPCIGPESPPVSRLGRG